MRILKEAMSADTHGSFRLTEAVRPLGVVPRQGYRYGAYRDGSTVIPLLMAAASRELLFDLFLELLDLLGGEVDVVLEISHDRTDGTHLDLIREGMELPVFKSILCDYEPLLLNDGCLGVAACNAEAQREVGFDEHKQLVAYGWDLGPFEAVLKKYGVHLDPHIRFLSEGQHMHCSSQRYAAECQRLREVLGADEVFP